MNTIRKAVFSLRIRNCKSYVYTFDISGICFGKDAAKAIRFNTFQEAKAVNDQVNFFIQLTGLKTDVRQLAVRIIEIARDLKESRVTSEG